MDTGLVMAAGGDQMEPKVGDLTLRFTAIGGINTPTGANITSPQARLEATNERIVLEPRLRLTSFIVGLMGSGRRPWVLPRTEIMRVRPASGQIVGFNTGVEIFTRDHTLWIFWHREPRRVLAALAALGYPMRYTYS